jgi:hypothetical protein
MFDNQFPPNRSQAQASLIAKPRISHRSDFARMANFHSAIGRSPGELNGGLALPALA